MAAEYDYDQAYECLGYIWYYGRTGKVDHKKAYEYFSKLMDKGNPVAAYKVADMYKNGYYVEKNQKKYEEIIEALYPKTEDMYYLLNKNCRVSFYYGDKGLEIQSEMANGKEIAFAGKWFLDIDSFFRDASINDYKLTGVASRLFGFKINEAI